MKVLSKINITPEMVDWIWKRYGLKDLIFDFDRELNMVYTILDNIIIIILSILGLFHSKEPEFLIIIAASLMIITTARSFHEDKDSAMIALYIVLLSVFSILSGNFTGFFVFFFLKGVKTYIRVFIGISMFLFVQLVIDQNTSIAMCILLTIILIVGFMLFAFVYSMIEQVEKRKVKENERMIASNISEMHEKRLNEQLVIQNFMAERNARLLERENISRNIHNSVGHSITAAIMTLDAADMLYDVKPDEARKKMKDANNRIRGSLESIRRAVRVLDEENEELTANDLKSQLDLIITEFVMDTSIQIRQNYGNLRDDIKIPHNHVVFLTGVLQEILTNGVKHGGANEFMVILLGDSAHVRLEISDNGRSDFSNSNCKQRIENGFGIKKIISYVEKCGGKTKFANENGFQSMIEIPIVFGE